LHQRVIPIICLLRCQRSREPGWSRRSIQPGCWSLSVPRHRSLPAEPFPIDICPTEATDSVTDLWCHLRTIWCTYSGRRSRTTPNVWAL